MIGFAVNPNSVYIPTIQTGCMKVEFDSTYPIHLNGIISQDEFRESINRINRTISSNTNLISFTVIFILCFVAGIICFIVGGVTAVTSGTAGFSPLIGVGIGIMIFAVIIIAVGCFTVNSRRVGRMRQVINQESMKYSSRSPTPCSWRLDITRQYGNAYGNSYNSRVVYHLVIDIGRSNVQANAAQFSYQGPSESSVLFGRQDNSVPPPYPNQTAGLCFQCGAPRQDITAKFCSSCGHSFNKS